jgi:hypothetical protein
MNTRTDKSNRINSASGAKPVVRIRQAGEHRRLDFSTPESVIHIPSRKELKITLEFYGRTPFIRSIMPTVEMRRFYAERTRPALRWYCTHFNEPIPTWLVGTPGVDEEYSQDDLDTLYGPEPLDVVEFSRAQTQEVPEAGGEGT